MSNGYFSFNSNRFNVEVQSISYSHEIDMSSSYGRQRQTEYPKKWSQKSMSVALIFSSTDDYLAFGEYMREYMFLATSRNSYLPLRFVCPSISADLCVLPSSVPIAIAVETVAPKMNLSLAVIANNNVETLRRGSSEAAYADYWKQSGMVERSDSVDDLDRFYRGDDSVTRSIVVSLVLAGEVWDMIDGANWRPVTYSNGSFFVDGRVIGYEEVLWLCGGEAAVRGTVN